METSKKAHRSLQYYMRAIHRVLGYLAVGMVFVYAFSGIVLIHRSGNFMKQSHEVSDTLRPGLTADELGSELNIRHLNVTAETPEAITFQNGTYDRTTGAVTYTKKELPGFLNKMVNLHKLPDAKNHTIAVMTTIFGIVLFLLALTSLFMYSPKTSQFKRNMLYTFIGVVFTVILVLVV